MPTTAPSETESDLATAMKREAAVVESYLEAALDQRPLPKNLREATAYGLLGGGKRMRPILVLWACRAVGGSPQNAMPAAAAIELVHCFSLVHDDLPAMDDDDLRRGRPTLHRHTNEAMAILAGDLMSSLAFELIATRMPAELAGLITRELAIGTNDMIAGQVFDTLPDFDAATPPLDRLKAIHRNKTGALIRCACRMGAIVGSGTGTSSEPLACLTRYGEAIGLMFQVVDDLLDVTQTTEHLGKKAGKDADKGKLTYPGLIGIDASRREVERLEAEAYDALKPLGDDARLLRELCEFMAKRTK
jgi:geranylgeranyl diphosphate synthase type II